MIKLVAKFLTVWKLMILLKQVNDIAISPIDREENSCLLYGQLWDVFD